VICRGVRSVPQVLVQWSSSLAALATCGQVLVQWSSSPAALATWEDREALKQRFPHAPAWGQTDFKGEGIVMTPDDGAKAEEMNSGPVR
jgi:glutamine cyclotransferase